MTSRVGERQFMTLSVRDVSVDSVVDSCISIKDFFEKLNGYVHIVLYENIWNLAG